MMTKKPLRLANRETYPDMSLNYGLKPCPRCGSKHCVPAVRVGPAVLMFTHTDYKVDCLKCYLKSQSARTAEGAIENWNAGRLKYKISDLRKQNGMTQQELSERSGIALETVRRYETREATPSRSYKTKLAQAFGISPKDI